MSADVHMLRPTLNHLPNWPLPAGYRFRGYREGDVATWVALHQDAEPFVTVTEATFAGAFGAHPAALPDRMFFAETLAGEAAGSSTAWWIDDWQGTGNWGQVHWVVVARAHQQRGLAQALLAQTLARLAASHHRALLSTNTARPWAIKVYLDAGFVPWPHELEDGAVLAAWQELQEILHHPVLANVLALKMSTARSEGVKNTKRNSMRRVLCDAALTVHRCP